MGQALGTPGEKKSSKLEEDAASAAVIADVPWPKIKDIEVSEPWAGYIFSGEKEVEGRKNNPKSWGATKAGDNLNVIEMKDGVKTGRAEIFKVVAVRTYPSLRDYLMAETVSKVLPGKNTIEEGEAVYLGFGGATPDAIAIRQEEYDEHGVIAIELAPLSKA